MHRLALSIAIVIANLTGARAVAQEEKKKERTFPPGYADLLAKADQIELLSLDPRSPKDDEEGLYGYVVLGRTTLKDDDRKTAVEAVRRTYREGDPKVYFFCYEPRHCLRAKRGDRTVDFMICFACYRMRVHEAGREVKSYAIGGESKDTQAPLDEILKAAKVPLPANDNAK